MDNFTIDDLTHTELYCEDCEKKTVHGICSDPKIELCLECYYKE